ncbi:MAG: CUAEP/CCAEP-tail radical SAM (seleno)protein [Terriglobia bacterium]
MNVVLISMYELGRQPFGLASPAAWLRRAGFRVACLDLSREAPDEKAVEDADFIALYLPMHTATRLAVEALPRMRQLNPTAHLCFYGLYAPVNEDYLRKLGAETILGGEFEEALLNAVERARQGQPTQVDPAVSLARLKFAVPDRRGLPALGRYARLEHPDGASRVVGYTEASRGCKHLCRHCPVVPVYQGRFRIVPPEIVLEDVRQQVAAGAEHITFGDPDFFNGIRHALRIVTALHQEFPNLTYDATIKVEHLLKHSIDLPALRETGCLFVTTAVESVDDRILALLGKGHTYRDFVQVLHLFRQTGLALAPTFVAFTPWIGPEGYCELLDAIGRHDLVESVAPVQLGLRLLIPAGSRLLELEQVRKTIGPFDEAGLVYPWKHSDSRVEALYARVQQIIRQGLNQKATREGIFQRVSSAAHEAAGLPLPGRLIKDGGVAIPHVTEPWYCCAEPLGES